MGTARDPVPVKLIIPMLSQDSALLDDVSAPLAQEFGDTDYCSPDLPFAHTTYYEREMGDHLLRRFVSFGRLIDPADLAEIKLITNGLEQQWAVEGQRRINLDPGYLSAGKLVLATTKNHAHRIYLGRGIYAEVTLAYREGEFRAWPWTYPDYRTPEYASILRDIRTLYMAQVRRLRAKD